MEKKLELIKEAILEKKALKPLLLDLNKISPVTDYFLICSGQSPVQARAIADNIVDQLLEKANLKPYTQEGYKDGRWILLDFGDVVVHVMHQTERDFYNLETLWHDANISEF